MKRVQLLTYAEIITLILPVSTFLSIYVARSFSFRMIIICNVLILSGLLFIVFWTFFIKHKIKLLLLLISLSFISLLYAAYRNIEPPLPYEREVSVRLKLTSEPRVRKYSVQYTARLLEIDKTHAVFEPRVLFNVAIPGNKLERGYVVDVKGLFMELPFEKSESYAWYLRSRGIKAVFEGYSRGVEVFSKPVQYSPVSVSNRLKRYVGKVNERLLFFPQSEFATALLTGNRDNIPREVMDAFRRSGTVHILAVSGLHVGFISLFLYLILRMLRVPQTVNYLAVACVIVFYMIFIGEAPSVRRASLMFLCGIAVFLFDRDRNYINILAIAFTILWVVNPLIIMNPGFLLSFAATFGILFLVPHFNPWMKRFMPAFVASSVSATLGVQIYILPVMLSFFGSFPYINILANLPIVPLTGFALALEIISLMVYPIFLPLAVVISEVTLAVITLILRIATLCARVPPLTAVRFPPILIPLYFIAVTVLFLILFQRLEKREKDYE
ncbi:MAG: ComEC/Rec2 family competence protein [Spirochaetota bacterium]|nr:MAG: ComEC/Rec2 family competence protein [Spirochaetota bacterium]